MRAQVLSLSSNTTLLRRALPVLVRPYLVRTTSPNHISFLRSTSQATRFPKHDQKLLFTSVSSIRKFTSRATNVNDAGSIDLPIIQSMQQKIKEQLNAEAVSVKDAYGDGRHVSIDVVSTAFEGQSAVNRQRMVYKAIWEELQSAVHAVDQMTTKTPAEAAAGK
ncbi:putative BolA protein [Medicago truncatula]|uniref:BolA family transcriptional regulator n=1 Tax=Medicago truncatula TaxID=3880 RepID=I3SAF3_MEDTR|nr:protein BOLA4, chloroplastic/mitochondrial [Medicago truncatula]AFK37245.1 unknown [Medicago truncatula]KEH40967.1 BolA family transcriptional regulator [Medicago truncatula]RHN78442.1 putative BolA protein [Medicago truncatula]